jgi:hypothetical protein
LKELKELVQKIPRDGKILSPEAKYRTSGFGAGKGSIATTGVLWAACDEVVAFAKLGVAGYLTKQVEQFRDTLNDVMEELKDWGEEIGGDEVEDGDSDGEALSEVTGRLKTSHIENTQALLDDLMNSQQCIPRGDPNHIRERLESCLRRLRMTTLLYQAILRRRLKNMPPLPPLSDSNIPTRLDEIMPILKKIPERFGSLALAFYELEPSEIDNVMDQCYSDAHAVSELLLQPWDGIKDEFTDWAMKFQSEIKKS